MQHVSRFPFPVLAVLTTSLGAQQALPPLPDTTGFGVHVLALGRAPDDAVWVGTSGQGIFVARKGAGSRSNPRTIPPRGRFPSTSCTLSDSGRTGRSGTARWGTGGACRPTAA